MCSWAYLSSGQPVQEGHLVEGEQVVDAGREGPVAFKGGR